MIGHARAAVPADFAAIRGLVLRAFAANGPVATVEILEGLRADNCILGEWIAEAGGHLLAHIAFSRVWVEAPEGRRVAAAILAPLSVCPDRQRSGIGSNLTWFALAALERAGETTVLVLGHPAYYRRFGFRSERAIGIESPWGHRPSFMARGGDVPTGRLVLPRILSAGH